MGLLKESLGYDVDLVVGLWLVGMQFEEAAVEVGSKREDSMPWAVVNFAMRIAPVETLVGLVWGPHIHHSSRLEHDERSWGRMTLSYIEPEDDFHVPGLGTGGFAAFGTLCSCEEDPCAPSTASMRRNHAGFGYPD